jgi:hypothetical protein
VRCGESGSCEKQSRCRDQGRELHLEEVKVMCLYKLEILIGICFQDGNWLLFGVSRRWGVQRFIIFSNSLKNALHFSLRLSIHYLGEQDGATIQFLPQTIGKRRIQSLSSRQIWYSGVTRIYSRFEGEVRQCESKS